MTNRSLTLIIALAVVAVLVKNIVVNVASYSYIREPHEGVYLQF